jgi:hypothetical protein
MFQPFWGKYRGKVETNVDPQQLGRLQVSCPAVLGGGRLAWALPCVPYAGSGVGLVLTPPVGANVWVEFEGGDPGSPIWSGCFWGLGELPAKPALPPIKLLQTDGLTLKLDDTPGVGGFTLEVKAPAVGSPPLKLTMTSAGIEISHGKAKVQLTAIGVSINDGALEVI